jgi:trehalose 6-phosphate synthase/phosphatase
MRDFEAYESVNARFADAVASRVRPGDLVWVHESCPGWSA